MKRFWFCFFTQIFLWGLLTTRVLAAPGTIYLVYVNDQYQTPVYSTATTANLEFSSLSIGNTLMIYDNDSLIRQVDIGATRMTISITGLSQTDHQFNGRMVDSVGETGPISDTHEYIVDLTAPAAPVLSLINGQPSPEESSSNNVSLLITNLNTDDYLTVFDGGSTAVVNFLAVGGSATINLSAVLAGTHNYQATATDRAGNQSVLSNIFVYTMTGTNLSKLITPRFLGNPLAAGTFMNPRYLNPHYYPRNIWDMQIFDGKVYFGSGNSSNDAPDSNWGPMSLWYYNLGTTSFGSDQIINQVGTTVNYVDEEQVDKFRIINGSLWTPGHDSQESWSLGNAYRYDGNGIWTKFRTIPDGIHVYDLAYLNGKMYAALGAGATTSIYESSDGGTSWGAVANTSTTGSYRIYDLFIFNNELYGVSTVSYNSILSNSSIYKFDGSNFQKYSILGTDFIPGSTKIVPQMGYYDAFRMIRSTEFDNNLLFIASYESNDHQWSPHKFYKTSDMQHGTLINLTDGAIPYDIKVDGSTIYVLAAKKLSDTSYINYVFSSTDTNTWNEVLHFNYQTYALSFEKNNNDFYFGMGTGQPPSWMDYYADSTNLSAKSGDILQIKREDYLALTPTIESINGTIGSVTTEQTTASILISNLDIGSSMAVYDGSNLIGAKIALGTTDTITVSDLSLGEHLLKIRAMNVDGSSTADSVTVSYTVVSAPTPTPTPTDIPTPTPTDIPTPTPTDIPTPTPTDIPTPTPTDIPTPTPTDIPTPTPTDIPTPTPTDIPTPTPTDIPTPTPTDIPTPTPTDIPTPTPTDIPTPTPTDIPTPTPTPTPIIVEAANIGDLITGGIFVPPEGTLPAETPKITTTNEIFIKVGNTLSLTTINLALNTEITRNDGQSFDAGLISAENMAKNSVSNFSAGFVPEAVMQWGIPGITLVFSKPVLINMYVGADQNGQTLNVFRSASVFSGWTNDGIALPTCVVADGSCQFSITKASYFTLASYQAPSVSQNSSPSQSGGDSNRNNVCSDATPIIGPDLFEIRAEKGKAKLFYSPGSVATGYAVLYGLKKGDERFGTIASVINSNSGVQNAEIKSLNPKLNYYFKVAAINGCNVSKWSEWVPIQANKKRTVYKYKLIIKNKIKTLVSLFK